MSITMFKAKNSKVVSNREVRQHRRDGWTFKPSKTALQQKISKPKKPRATLKVKEDDIKIVEPKININLPGPEDFNSQIKE